MSGLIPQPFIDEIIARTDLIDFIDSYVPLKKRGNSYIACCPFHNEKTPSFNVNDKKQFYHCFGCGESGNVISFAMRYLNLDFVLAIETLAQKLGLEVPKSQGAPQRALSKKLSPILNDITQYYQKLLNDTLEAKTYLQNRGLDEATLSAYQIGYASDAWHALVQRFQARTTELIETGMLIKNDKAQTYDRYRQRIMFPIHNRKGEIIGFGGRAILPDQAPKYLNSPETPLFQKSRELYGLYQVLNQKTPIETLFVVEGYIDVLSLAQAGIHNAVATLGTATTAHHLQVLTKYTPQIIFCFDGDNAGRKAAWKALEISLPFVNQGLEAKFMFLPEGHDPDSLIKAEGAQAFIQRSQHAQNLDSFLMQHLTEGLNLNLLAHKNQLLKQTRPYLESMGPGAYQDLIIKQLSRLTTLDPQEILKHLKNPLEVTLNPPQSKIRRTPQRIAVALLIQNPQHYRAIASMLPPDYFKGVEPALLSQLMEMILTRPECNAASLIECFREKEGFKILSDLLIWDHQVPEAALEKEFIDTLQFLLKQKRETTILTLLNKSKIEGLTSADKETLSQLLKEKHQT